MADESNLTVDQVGYVAEDPVRAEFTGGVGAIFVFTIFLLPLIVVIAIIPIINFLIPAIGCAIMRWICDKTRYGNKRFRFTGTGAGLIGNYIKWTLLAYITLGIYEFWSIRNQIKWFIENIELVD